MSLSEGTYEFGGNDWGDLGGGFYKNPVLNADYSDPDVVCVGSDFYMVCSDFHYMGIPVLHSKDLVNWRIVGQVYDRLDIHERYDKMEGYGKGSWAPALKYHKGRFYVYFCTPDEGLYMSSAEYAEGPWKPLHEVKRVAGWEDPCPFWDDDGSAYLGHSTVGAGPIMIHKMSGDGKRLLDDGAVVYVGKVAEGTKIYKRERYYYLVIPEGGVEKGWQTVLRSENIYGPYERKVVLQTGRTGINGPHQGGLVETPGGETWFMHFQSAGALGRVCHLQPVRWVDGWPLMGEEGEPVGIFRKPDVGGNYPAALPQASDDFDRPRLGCQWQWNHNPVNENWSLSWRPGYLCLKAMCAENIFKARNTLTQKMMGSRADMLAELDTQNMRSGQRAGLAYLGGNEENWIGIVKKGDACRIEAVAAGIVCHGPEVRTPVVWLKTVFDLSAETFFCFSTDGQRYYRLGGACKIRAGHWKGVRVGLFSFNTEAAAGRADFHRFRYDIKMSRDELKVKR
jgi:beta-xylosidase